MPYEKIGKNEPVCIADEVPFEIPESWEWCRIGELFFLQAGKNISSSSISEKPFANAIPCYGGNGIRGYIVGDFLKQSHILYTKFLIASVYKGILHKTTKNGLPTY